MAKFSAKREGDDSEEGSSSPKQKRQRRLDGEEGRIKAEQGSKGIKEDQDPVPSQTDRDASVSVTFIDPDVLDCPICSESLTPPVFQCENGHIACSSCCGKLENKCPTCSWPIGYSRCRAIEKVVESIKVSCGNVIYGCKEIVSYIQRQSHEEKCIYTPCICPFSECIFQGSSEKLSLHFSSKHCDFHRHFRYNRPFQVLMDDRQPFLLLQAEEDGLLFLLNNQSELIGNAITVTYIGPNSPKGGFSYEVITRRVGTSLKLQAFIKSTKGRMEDPPMEFLLVPADFCNVYGQFNLEICIWNSKDEE